jgi:hypothetical protein
MLEPQLFEQIKCDMEVTAVVLHRGALARYMVAESGKDGFVAHLLAYSGDPASSPPQQVSLQKEGRHCMGNVDDVGLMDEIYFAVKEKLNGRA